MIDSGFNVREYWEKRLGKDYSIRGVGHQGYGRYFNQWMYRVRRVVFQRALRKLYVAAGTSKALDVGSGTGFYIGLLDQAGLRDITGVDITAVAVARLKERHPRHRFLQIDISEENAAERIGIEQYDLITAFDVLFHIVDDAAYLRALKNLSRCLKKGGHLLFSDNFVHDHAWRTSHQVSRSLESISRAVKCADLDVIERVPMFMLMNTPVDVGSPLWTKLWTAFMLPVRVLGIMGFFYGLILFPLELAMVSLSRESPSTEMAVCRKPVS